MLMKLSLDFASVPLSVGAKFGFDPCPCVGVDLLEQVLPHLVALL